MVHNVSGLTQGVQEKLWDPVRTRAIPERNWMCACSLWGAIQIHVYLTLLQVKLWSMPERFKVVLTMQGAIQVLGFTFTFYLTLRFRQQHSERAWILGRAHNGIQVSPSMTTCAGVGFFPRVSLSLSHSKFSQLQLTGVHLFPIGLS